MREADLMYELALCVDGPLAGEELQVSAPDGVPPQIIDVADVPYVLGVQSRSGPGRRWRYHVLRGELEGEASSGAEARVD